MVRAARRMAQTPPKKKAVDPEIGRGPASTPELVEQK